MNPFRQLLEEYAANMLAALQEGEAVVTSTPQDDGTTTHRIRFQKREDATSAN